MCIKSGFDSYDSALDQDARGTVEDIHEVFQALKEAIALGDAGTTPSTQVLDSWKATVATLGNRGIN